MEKDCMEAMELLQLEMPVNEPFAEEDNTDRKVEDSALNLNSSMPSRKELSEMMHAWYEAGYKTGRIEALRELSKTTQDNNLNPSKVDPKWKNDREIRMEQNAQYSSNEHTVQHQPPYSPKEPTVQYSPKDRHSPYLPRDYNSKYSAKDHNAHYAPHDLLLERDMHLPWNEENAYAQPRYKHAARYAPRPVVYEERMEAYRPMRDYYGRTHQSMRYPPAFPRPYEQRVSSREDMQQYYNGEEHWRS